MTKYRCTKFDEFQGFIHVGGERGEGGEAKINLKTHGCVFLHSQSLAWIMRDFVRRIFSTLFPIAS